MTNQDNQAPNWRRSLPWRQRGAFLVSKYELAAALATLQSQVDELRRQVERLHHDGSSAEPDSARPS